MSDGSFLPPNATDLAVALDLLENRLFDLPLTALTKDPLLVEAHLLDHLAWEFSVDVWRSDWSELRKRVALSTSDKVHRHKGTPYAVKETLAVFGAAIELVEWWQPDGIALGMERGSYQITVVAGPALYGASENDLDLSTLEAMQAAVLRVAPVSRALIFGLKEVFRGDVTYGAGVTAARVHRVTDEIRPAPAEAVAASAVALGVAGVTVHHVSLYVE